MQRNVKVIATLVPTKSTKIFKTVPLPRKKVEQTYISEENVTTLHKTPPTLHDLSKEGEGGLAYMEIFETILASTKGMDSKSYLTLHTKN